MSEVVKKSAEERGDFKDEIEHVLDRPGTWIGSTINELVEYPVFVPSKNRIIKAPNIAINEGLLKLIDEVISNSVDEHRRPEDEILYRITEIDVEVNLDGSVVVKDNGGIPVVVHKKFSKKIGKPTLFPEMIFGHLRTGTNYDDTVKRNVVGTNGLGSKLTNILSKHFTVQTCDGKNSVCIEWSDNMGKCSHDYEKYPETGFYIKPEDPSDKDNHGTKISFQMDLERFEMESINPTTIRLLQRRCIDAAASNPGLIINFKSDAYDGKLNSTWQFNSFKEYARLYFDDDLYSKILQYTTSSKDTILVVPENLGFDIGFVNGALCSEGTHITKVKNQMVNAILDLCEKNGMDVITKTDVTNHMSVFVDAKIINPKYDSQSKDKLATRIDKFKLRFDDKFIDGLKKTSIYEAIKAFYEVKYLAVKKKETAKLNAKLKVTKSKKLIKCASRSGNNELWLFEGTSASNGFRKARNLNQSAYLLRGKIKNTFNLDRMQIFENVELKEVISALGILFGKPKTNLKDCNYDKIVIATDMDFDGNHICGLLIAFFAVHFPELIKDGRLYRAISPIVVARKGKGKKLEKKYYYTMQDYKNDEKSLKGYDIIYTKGLGGLEDDDYYKMLREPKLMRFTMDNVEDFESIKVWFDKSTTQRKQLLIDSDSSGIVEEVA